MRPTTGQKKNAMVNNPGTDRITIEASNRYSTLVYTRDNLSSHEEYKLRQFFPSVNRDGGLDEQFTLLNLALVKGQ